MKAKLQTKKNIEEINLVNIPGDLPVHHPHQKSLENNRGSFRYIELMDRLLQKAISNCAAQIQVDKEELQAWVNCQIEVPHKTILHLLRSSYEYKLDPLQEEIVITQYDDNWQVSISVDGWIKLLHQHPAYTGIHFSQSPEPENLSSTWMECTIYRSDEIMPTTVREYLSEVQNDGEIWKKMPRRMLRHRVLQQCARLAIGIRPPQMENHLQEKPTGQKISADQESQNILADNQLPQSKKLKLLLEKQ